MPPTDPPDDDHEPGERHQRVSTVVICLAFSVIGVAFLVGGDPGARAIGLIAVVFFGGGGLVYWGLTAQRGRDVPPTEVGLADDERVTYPVSRSRAALVSVGAAIFVIVGGAMVLAPTVVASSVAPHLW